VTRLRLIQWDAKTATLRTTMDRHTRKMIITKIGDNSDKQIIHRYKVVIATTGCDDGS